MCSYIQMRSEIDSLLVQIGNCLKNRTVTPLHEWLPATIFAGPSLKDTIERALEVLACDRLEQMHVYDHIECMLQLLFCSILSAQKSAAEIDEWFQFFDKVTGKQTMFRTLCTSSVCNKGRRDVLLLWAHRSMITPEMIQYASREGDTELLALCINDTVSK